VTEVERLLADYKADHLSGAAPDPREYLSRAADAADRELLAALIDAYLSQAERRPFDDAAFGSSRAAAVSEQVHRSLAGAGGLWPALLPRLRSHARLRRAELVAELAARLGAQSQRDKVALYYHQMEQGLLPEKGVSDTVLDAIGKIVGYTGEALRRAGQMPAPGPPRADEGAVFARATYGEPAEAARQERPAEQWDEVDRLFRGGSG
jgi:hypothetical protein